VDVESPIHSRGDLRDMTAEDREGVHRLSEAERSLRRIRLALGNQRERPEDSAEKLAAMAEATEKAKRQLQKAERELRSVVALIQKVRLSLMGLGDD